MTATGLYDARHGVESFIPRLIHFALNDPSYAPMTSSLTSSEIPITQPYHDVIVDLRVRVRVRVRVRASYVRGLP